MQNAKVSRQPAAKNQFVLRTLVRRMSDYNLIDYVVFGLIGLCCFLSFQQRDLMHTVGCSVGYLNGHFSDFYDYCGTFDIHPSYMPTVYLLFAVWNLPMKALGVLTVPTENIPVLAALWSKLLPCIIYMLSARLVYRICRTIGMGSIRARLCAGACITMPIAFYDQFIFGQYDIFMTACVLLGVLAWLERKDLWFVFWFALAMTFKYTALVIFVPMVLLREKRVGRIIAACVLLMVLFALEYLLYRHSPGFRNYTFGIGSSGDNPTGYIFSAGFYTGFSLSAKDLSVSLVVLVYGLILGKAYFTEAGSSAEEAQWMMYLSCLSFFVLFGLSKWHPQWLLFAVPFWTISAFMHKDTKIFMIIDLIFMICFVIFITETIPNNVDQAMLNNGIFRSMVNGNIGTEKMIRDYVGVIDENLSLSLISMIMLVYAVFKHPRYLTADLTSTPAGIGWIRARFVLGVGFFVAPAFLCLRAATTAPWPLVRLEMAECDNAASLTDLGDTASQSFSFDGNVMTKLQFPVIVNGRINSGYLKLTLKDGEGTILYEEDWQTADLVDGDLLTAELGGIPVAKDTYYTAEISVTQANGDFLMSLPMLNGESQENMEIGLLNGDELPGQIAMTVYGQ